MPDVPVHGSACQGVEDVWDGQAVPWRPALAGE